MTIRYKRQFSTWFITVGLHHFVKQTFHHYFILFFVSSALNILGSLAYKSNVVGEGGTELTILLTINNNEGSVIMSNNMKEVAELFPETSCRSI